MYEYQAYVRSIYDADTIRFDIDLGFGARLMNQSIRLFGIDAWEIRGTERPMGIRARDAVNSLLSKGDGVILNTYRDKKGKYGRWLADIYLSDGTHLNEWLVSEGHAERAEY